MTVPLPSGTGDAARAVLGALGELRRVLEGVTLPLDIEDAAMARADRQEVLDQLSDYVIPRYEQLEAPLLAVVGGSTGAGKSTLVNALLREHVTTASAIRPTTRRPLLVHHPDDAAWFADDRIFPGLARVTVAPGSPPTPAVTGDGGVHRELELRASSALPRGLALLDAPDIDSVVTENRQLANQLLAAADLWVFVTTAARYGDAIPWALLTEAADRRIVVAVVLDRVPHGVSAEVRQDLAARLDEEGLGRAPLFVISETTMAEDGLLPADDVAALQGWLHGIAADAGSRASVARQTLGGAVDAALARASLVGEGAQHQTQTLVRLAGHVDEAYAQAHHRIMSATADGAMLRGEVLARWQEFVGTGDFFRSVEAQVGRVRDRIGNFFRGRPAPTEQVEVAIETGLQTLLVAEAERAAAEVDHLWRREPGARGVLAAATAALPSEERLIDDAAAEVRGWQDDLLGMVRREGADKRLTARMLSFGVNGLGIALMVVMFASTAGLTGAEIAIAGGTAVVAQKLLEAVFGDDAVRKMTAAARHDLHARAGALLAEQADSYRHALSDLGIDAGATERIAGAITAVRAARRAEAGL
ncbi:dynamin family protein [Georgenia sp. EYE_87]|uniref:dynamin family protein n=1 Tax=Georgenia sp. EYE_87 TaxID=2853448 RepID=UPI002004402B|nr:dynamin family protein [Georgenia sp. EYE_87]MCK6209241.1 dynamin family protein [Georgenia sp. EYE_87]